MELWGGYNSDKDLLLSPSCIFAGGRCSMIPRFYTILSDGQRENEVKSLCQHIVWVLTDNLNLNCLDLLGMDCC